MLVSCREFGISPKIKVAPRIVYSSLIKRKALSGIFRFWKRAAKSAGRNEWKRDDGKDERNGMAKG